MKLRTLLFAITLNATLSSSIHGQSFYSFLSGSNEVRSLLGDYNSACGFWAGYRQWNYGSPEGSHNTYSGTLAGYNNTSGSHNSFVGAFAGYNNNNGNYNTVVGNSAGYSNTSGSYNNFVGYRAGYTNTIGTDNNFIGYQAGFYNSSGTYNTFLGNYAGYRNTTASYNSFVGYYAGYNNTTGTHNTFLGRRSGYSNNAGKYNSFVGSDAGSSNNTGSYNTATGYRALLANTSGSYNTAYGVDALYSNSTGTNNTGIGIDALSLNNTGYNNTATGLNVMFKNTGGYNNTANGKEAMFENTTGFNNTAVGAYALQGNTTGSRNSALGDSAGADFNSSYSTFIGYKTNVTLTGLTNVTVVGHRASATASNQVRLGNTSVTSIGGKVSWTTLSDGRFKKNIKEDVPGLSFINKLRPVTYNLDLISLDKKIYPQQTGEGLDVAENETAITEAQSKIKYTGFLAQDVEKAAADLSYDFSGLDKPKNTNDLYGLRYSDFIVPVIKAVQELSKKNEELEKENTQLRNQNDNILQRLEKMELLLAQNRGNSVPATSPYLGQNIPNPSTGSTTITYYLPATSQHSKLVVTDTNGRILKTIPLTGKGNGQVQFNSKTLPAGIYRYTLYTNNHEVDSKQMVLLR